MFFNVFVDFIFWYLQFFFIENYFLSFLMMRIVVVIFLWFDENMLFLLIRKIFPSNFFLSLYNRFFDLTHLLNFFFLIYNKFWIYIFFKNFNYFIYRRFNFLIMMKFNKFLWFIYTSSFKYSFAYIFQDCNVATIINNFLFAMS